MAVAAPLAMASQKMAGKIPSIDFVAGLANLLSCAKAALLTICLAAFKTAEF